MSKLRLLHRAYSALLRPVAFGASPTKHRAPIAASVFHCSALKSGPQPGRGRDGPASQLAVGVEVTPCGKKLCVSWEGGDDRDPVFHGVWLRHNCQCPLCLSSSGQKTLEKVHLDPKLTIVETSLQEGTLHVRFSCGHDARISLDWLRGNCYPRQWEGDSSTLMRNQPSIAKTIPEVSAAELDQDEGLWRWLMNLNEYGVCLLKDLPVEPSDQLLKVAQKVYHPQKTIYGEIVDVLSVENPINIANSSVALEYHMDLVYYESPPGLQLLHCLRADSCVEGGESIMLDTLPVVEQLKQEHPHHFHTLTRVPATFQKMHFDREKPVVMKYRRPHIAVDPHGKVVAVTWSPPFEGPLCVAEELVEDYYAAYTCFKNLIDHSKHKLVHRLVPGEVLTLNNHRYLHGRNSFSLNGGVRHLMVLYINIDEFKSQFAVLCSQLNKQDHQVKHVFNHCWS